MTEPSFDLTRTFVHLGLGAMATTLPDFSWSGDYMTQYAERFAADGAEGRLVCIVEQSADWDAWERHPAGEEVVVLLSGRVDIVQELGDGERVVSLEPGHAMINPPNVWHTAKAHAPGLVLFITPGRGTEGRPAT